jgi:hypothetical protein
LGIDVGIISTLMDNIPMRGHCDNNVIWGETSRIVRSQICDCDLQIIGPRPNDGPLTNISRFLHKLEHCSGEKAKVLHNHLKQSKLKIEGLGVEPNSREVVIVVVFSFTGHSGN